MKTRWRAGSVDNRGGSAIVDPFRNTSLRGERHDLTAKDVIELVDTDAAPDVSHAQGTTGTKRPASCKEVV
jgi:hypothetical protein